MRQTQTEPAPEAAPQVSERATRELCAEEHDGLRCMRPKGHPQQHETYATGELISWR